MHPITVIEIIVTSLIVVVFFSIALFVPVKFRKKALLSASVVTLGLGLSFVVRPFWINYQVEIKKEALNQYLAEKYPKETWEIRRRDGRQYNPYHLEVRFDNEPRWVYTYFVGDSKIYQSARSVPDGQGPIVGKHYEPKK
jgi:hypothetical protein